MRSPVGISVEAVTKHYATPAGVVRAVDGITFRVEPGTSLAVTGPSGCGKSTLLGLIGALETPTAGRVAFGDRSISDLSERERGRVRREEIGFVFQSDNLLPFLTAGENVSLQLALTGATEDYGHALELLDRVGLANRADQLPDQLSGGQSQRVAVARALVHRPQVILADEPTGSLDSQSSEYVLELLLSAHREAAATLILVTHDPWVASQLDRTLVLKDGRIVGDSRRVERPASDA